MESHHHQTPTKGHVVGEGGGTSETIGDEVSAPGIIITVGTPMTGGTTVVTTIHKEATSLDQITKTGETRTLLLNSTKFLDNSSMDSMDKLKATPTNFKTNTKAIGNRLPTTAPTPTLVCSSNNNHHST